MRTTTAALVKQLKACRDTIAAVRDLANMHNLTDTANYLDKKVTGRLSTAIRKIKSEDKKLYGPKK